MDRIGLLELIPYGVVLVVVLGIIALQHHMSGMILIVVAAASVLFASGISLGWFAAGGTLVAGALLWIITKTEYMTARIDIWQDPFKDPRGDGFQPIQSMTSIGSGGLLGVGLGNSRQKYLFLPEEHNDYIFAIVCEELGMVGACVIMALFALLIIRGYWLALHARDRFGTLLLVGITSLMAFQVFFNIGVVTNFLPPHGHLAAVFQLWRHGPGHSAGGDGHGAQRIQADRRAQGGVGGRAMRVIFTCGGSAGRCESCPGRGPGV